VAALQRLPVSDFRAGQPGQPLITGLARPRPPRIADTPRTQLAKLLPRKWRPELPRQKAA